MLAYLRHIVSMECTQDLQYCIMIFSVQTILCIFLSIFLPIVLDQNDVQAAKYTLLIQTLNDCLPHKS